jgi:hypothetical protein
MMYYKAFSEIGGSLCYAVSSGDGSKRKGSLKGLFDCAECCLQHKSDVKKGWHKGIRLDVRGKSASGPGAWRDYVDSQLSNAGKGQHLNRRAEIATRGNQLVGNAAQLCCEGAAESARDQEGSDDARYRL